MDISFELLLLILSLLFLISMLATKASAKLGVPVLLLFLGVGMLFGSDGIGIVKFESIKAASIIGSVALCIILFSGGLDTKIENVRPIIKEGVVLATIGVLLTALLTGFFIWQFTQRFTPLNFTFLEAMLLASIMSSTDSASVFNILRSKGVALKNNMGPMLELESGSNDPMAYLLTVTLISIIMSGEPVSIPSVMLMLAVQLIVGALAGYLLGKYSVRIINRINLPNDSLYPILLFTTCIFIFSVTYFLKGNGYLAVYIAGLVVGNSKFYTKRTTTNFFDGLAWLSQIAMFLTLGLLVNPSELIFIAVPAVVISVFMILAGRPFSVFACLIPFKHRFNSMTFISWVGLRGAVPIVFAMLPLVAGVPHAKDMFNIVFFITLLSLLLQGSFITTVAKWLDLSDGQGTNGKLKDFDFEFSEDIKSIMTEISINEEQLTNGNRLMDIPLPDKTLVVMVKRDGDHYFIPKGNTELRAKDKLLVITDDEKALLETYDAMGISKFTLKRNK